MAEVILLHGTRGNPESNWLPWIKSQLSSRRVKVHVPQFPTPVGQSLSSWLKVFETEVEELKPASILVGHSMGCGFALRLLERAKLPIRATVLVSGFADGNLNLADYDTLNSSFFADPFTWPQIIANAGTTVCFHGDNDPYVPLSFGQELADHLKTQLRTVPGGGHLNAAAGYAEFPALLETLLRLI